MITKTGAALAALATAVALASCAGRATPEQAAYDQVIDKVYGTPEQRQAAAEAGWLRTQLAIASCMARAGQQYMPAPFRPLPDTGIAPGDLLAFAPAREDFGVGRRVQALAAAGDTAQPALAGADANQAAKYTQAVSGCATGEVTDAGNPKGQEVLDGQLVATLTEVEKSATPTLADDYPACLAEQGLRARNLSQLYVKVEQAYPPISYEKKSDATKADGWALATTFERKAAAADASCRTHAVEVAIVAAKPVLERFADDHAAGLDAVAAGWAQATKDVVTLRAKVS